MSLEVADTGESAACDAEGDGNCHEERMLSVHWSSDATSPAKCLIRLSPKQFADISGALKAAGAAVVHSVSAPCDVLSVTKRAVTIVLRQVRHVE